MKIYFFPATSSFNPYIDNIVKGIEANGVIVVNKKDNTKYKKLFSSFRAMMMRTNVYHFNWIENRSAVDTKKNRVICQLILLWLSIMKLSGGKLVWTMHNKESHFASGNKEFHYQFMMKFIAKMDMILVHAKETASLLEEFYNYPNDRICYVPHGNYVTEAEQPSYEKHDKFTLLAFGMVNRYKNIPMLADVFKELDLNDAELKIYGKCDEKDPELFNIIKNKLDGVDNIFYDNRFIPDEEVASIFSLGDIVLLPYDKQSMMNSGAAIKAFSEGKPIIVSKFGAIKDLSEKSFVHSYDYESSEEHHQNLKKVIFDVYNQWKHNPFSLIKEGNEAFFYSKNDLDWNNICQVVVEFYKKIIS